jgi:hypothetical protein
MDTIARIAATVQHSDDKKRIFIGRVRDQTVSHRLKT